LPSDSPLPLLLSSGEELYHAGQNSMCAIRRKRGAHTPLFFIVFDDNSLACPQYAAKPVRRQFYARGCDLILRTAVRLLPRVAFL
jgi:hypothetical protein